MDGSVNTQSVHGTSDMPAPQTMNYNNLYKVTPLFRNDLSIVLKETAYVDVKRIFNMLDIHKNVLPAAILNDFLRTLSNLPYKTIAPLMRVIENKDNFKKYFELIIPEKK